MEVRLGREGGVCGCVVASGPPNLKGGVANFFFSLLLSIRRWIWGTFFWTENFEGPCAPRAYRFSRGSCGALGMYFVPITFQDPLQMAALEATLDSRCALKSMQYGVVLDFN